MDFLVYDFLILPSMLKLLQEIICHDSYEFGHGNL